MISSRSVPFSALAFFVVLSSGAAYVACRQPGLSNGSSCVRATQCESLVCSFENADASVIGPDGAAVGACVGRCQSSADCASGLVCGRYDFRGIVPDSGGPDVAPTREGPDFEVLKACRPRGTVPCTSDGECASGEACLGAPRGVCAPRCSSSASCATRFCFNGPSREACGAPGACAARCDDGVECPSRWYCQFSYASDSVNGRCVPIDLPDAGCPAVEAGTLDDAASDAASDVVHAADAGRDAAGG